MSENEIEVSKGTVIFVSGADFSAKQAADRASVMQQFRANGYEAEEMVVTDFTETEKFLEKEGSRNFYVVDALGTGIDEDGLKAAGRASRLFGSYGAGIVVVAKNMDYIHADTCDLLASGKQVMGSYKNLSMAMASKGTDSFIADVSSLTKEARIDMRNIREVMQATRTATGTASRTTATFAPAPAPAG